VLERPRTRIATAAVALLAGGVSIGIFSQNNAEGSSVAHWLKDPPSMFQNGTPSAVASRVPSWKDGLLPRRSHLSITPDMLIGPPDGGPAPIVMTTPNPSILFTSATTGYWIDGSPTVGSSLAATTAGNFGIGTTLATTTNGGVTWTPMISDANGLFGIAFTNPNDGWATGEDYLYRTTDGGATWTAMSQTTSTPLTEVDFTDAMNGFGLDMNGYLYQSADGGQTWAPISEPGIAALSGICHAGTTEYSVDLQGDVYGSSDSGISWSQRYQSGYQYGNDPPAAQLYCSGNQITVAYQEGTQTAGGGTPYKIVTSPDGVNWTVVDDKFSGESDPMPSDLGQTLGAVTSIPGGATQFVTYLGGQGQVDCLAISGGGTSANILSSQTLGTSGIPSASLSPVPSWQSSLVYGASFVDSLHGWFSVGLLDDTDQHQQDAVFTTSDGGMTWTKVFEDSVQSTTN